MNYYNENDPKAAAWLRELIKENLISNGEVDERSICDVQPEDVKGFIQCHWYAGIGGWSYALRLAGVPDNYPVWTKSCPCQPFSGAGKRLGEKDPRHLWPESRRLISACHPSTVIGEQVASPDGRKWLAGIHTDLEALGFDFGAADLPSGGVFAPNNRARLYWVAHSRCASHESDRETRNASGENRGIEANEKERERSGASPPNHGTTGQSHPLCMGNSQQQGLEGHTGDVHNRSQPGRLAAGEDRSASQTGSASELDSICMGDSKSGGRGELWDEARQGSGGYPDSASESGGLEQPNSDRWQERESSSSIERYRSTIGPNGGIGFWDNYDIAICDDLDKEGRQKARRIESGTFPLASGVPNRVGLLRGYGNAINPVLAAVFIQAAFESINH